MKHSLLLMRTVADLRLVGRGGRDLALRLLLLLKQQLLLLLLLGSVIVVQRTRRSTRNLHRGKLLVGRLRRHSKLRQHIFMLTRQCTLEVYTFNTNAFAAMDCAKRCVGIVEIDEGIARHHGRGVRAAMALDDDIANHSILDENALKKFLRDFYVQLWMSEIFRNVRNV